MQAAGAQEAVAAGHQLMAAERTCGSCSRCSAAKHSLVACPLRRVCLLSVDMTRLILCCFFFFDERVPCSSSSSSSSSKSAAAAAAAAAATTAVAAAKDTDLLLTSMLLLHCSETRMMLTHTASAASTAAVMLSTDAVNQPTGRISYKAAYAHHLATPSA